MRRMLLVFLLGVLIGAIAVFAIRCPDSAKIAHWRGLYEAEQSARATDQAASLIRIADLEAEKALLNGAVTSANTVIAKKEEAIAERDTRIRELEAAEPVAPELETHPLVINLRAQIAEWKLKFSLAQDVIAEKDRIIAARDAQLVIQVRLTDEWKANYNSLYALYLNCEKGLALYERRASFTWPERILAGAVGYGAGKGIEALVKLIF
jgi:hypothetical protein